MARRKQSLASRQNAANVKAVLAVNLFEQAVDRLTQAADEQAEIIGEADQQIAYLEALRDKARDDHDAASETAERIRSLIGIR